MRVLVTDADYKHSLAATRSLGRKGIRVVCGSSIPYAQSFFSRYCSERFVYPSSTDEEGFLASMIDYVRANDIDVLMPVGLDTTMLLARAYDVFSEHTILPIAGFDKIVVASDKLKTIDLARKIGVEVPRVYASVDDVDQFPVVIKHRIRSGTVRYVKSKDDLLSTEPIPNDYVIQDYVLGDGFGFFALYNRGTCRASFMHRREREYPSTGGPSTAAVSICCEELRAIGTRVLDELCWNGVAMVEFKKDRRDGRYKLIEINPKLWGSLDLAIASGVDFPSLLFQMAVEGDVPPVTEYTTGVRYRWPFPDDLLHAMSLNTVDTFIKDFFSGEYLTNIDRNDILPNIFQTASSVMSAFARISRRNLRYPDGSPGAVQ